MVLAPPILNPWRTPCDSVKSNKCRGENGTTKFKDLIKQVINENTLQLLSLHALLLANICSAFRQALNRPGSVWKLKCEGDSEVSIGGCLRVRVEEPLLDLYDRATAASAIAAQPAIALTSFSGGRTRRGASRHRCSRAVRVSRAKRT